MPRLRGISFDFAPGKSVQQVIKEVQEKAAKEVIREQIKTQPPGTTGTQIINNITPTTSSVDTKPTTKSSDTETTTKSSTPDFSADFSSQVPKQAGTQEEAIKKTQEFRITSNVGEATDEEVQKVYDGITFDFAPGQDPAEVIKEAQAGVDITPPSGSGNFVGETFPTPDEVYSGEEYGNGSGSGSGAGGTGTGGSGTGTNGTATTELTPYAQGGQWYAVTGYPGLPVAYFIEYNLPGGNKIYYYADRSDLDVLEGIGAGKEPPIVGTVTYSEFKKNRISGGSISDVVGTNEHYLTRVERTLQAPTGDLLLPTWANNSPEIKDLFYVAVAEGWSDTKLLRSMAGTDAFKTRYPAFNEMLSLTGGNHQQALVNYREYETEVRLLNNRYGEDADVGDLAAEAIRKGFSLEDLRATYDVFERAEKNADSLIAFQQVVNEAGLNFDVTSSTGIVDFFQGTAPTEIYDLYEASSITEQASRLELTDLSVDEALEIARATPGQLTQQQVSSALQTAAQTILRYRDFIDLGSYGLEADQIINLSLGYKEPGGMTEMELATAMSRIYQTDENLQNLASNLTGKSFQKDRQIRSIG